MNNNEVLNFEFDPNSSCTLQSSSSSCSYQLQSFSSLNANLNLSTEKFMETFGASNIWIMELRWHIESECSNILQSKIIPDIYNGMENSEKRKLPICLAADILEEKFGVIAECFQSIFRNSQANKTELFCISASEKLSKIINIIYDMLSQMRCDTVKIEEEDREILNDFTRIKCQLDKYLSDSQVNINLKFLLTNLIDYGRALANLKQFLIRHIIESFINYLKRQIRKRSFQNSSVNEILIEKSKLKNGKQYKIYFQKLNTLLCGVIKMIRRSHIYASVLIQCKCFHALIRICSLGYFQSNWALTLKLLTMLCTDAEAVVHFEKNRGLDVISGMMSNFSVSEIVLFEAARLIAQITYVKVSSINDCSKNSSACLGGLEANLEKLINSLIMLCLITVSSSSFITATMTINNLMFLFPEDLAIIKPKSIQILVSACLTDKAHSFLARVNVLQIFANISRSPDHEEILIKSNVIELSLQFLADFVDEKINSNRIWNETQKFCSKHNQSRYSERDLRFLTCLFRIFINLCCNEKNIDLLVENNDIESFYLCHQDFKCFKTSTTGLFGECLSMNEVIIKHIESKMNPLSSKNIHVFLKLNNARESDV